jgi:hypothetical protein
VVALHPSRRAYVKAYERVQRREAHRLVEDAVERAGGRVVWSSGYGVAPLFLVFDDRRGTRSAVMVYAFAANRRVTLNRPADEHRVQIRYGDVNDPAWRARHHPVGFDPTGAEVTLVLGTHSEADLLIALDPASYDPLPLGISVFFKDAEIQAAQATGWHVWERDNISGMRRASPRAQLGVETLVAFAPERLLDLVALERQAQALRLDPPLRFRAALRAARTEVDLDELHELEQEFALPAAEILEIIRERSRVGGRPLPRPRRSQRRAPFQGGARPRHHARPSPKKGRPTTG